VEGAFNATVEELPAIQRLLASARGKLGLGEKEFNALSLCCEEVFCHMTGGVPADGKQRLTLRLTKTEEGCFTEMVCGHMMDDINNFVLPESLFSAKPDELNQLGLALFAQFARDVKHLEISGYSYISFLI